MRLQVGWVNESRRPHTADSRSMVHPRLSILVASPCTKIPQMLLYIIARTITRIAGQSLRRFRAMFLGT
ncbi:hypothetical protein CABS01_05725 [Colletotrichum abscissum]|uniref:uncharacterized protein n=1 Tax=Colletotrichum abscissum TaxID=1671311 RepID=UPI0027D4AE4C|nr:uncharacterized protein CABS01_05725 [Colletotrichum abscissum]KAK1521220.1 hypothetical protein CABS01_05725 [Colletotrichum abscissum]